MTLSTGVRQTGQGRPPSSYTTAQVSHRRWPHGTRAHSRVVPKQTGHSSALGCLDGCLDGAGAAGRLKSDEPKGDASAPSCAGAGSPPMLKPNGEASAARVKPAKKPSGRRR